MPSGSYVEALRLLPPPTVTATAVEYNQIDVTWTVPNSRFDLLYWERYNINTDTVDNEDVIRDLGVTTFSETDLPSDGLYRYRMYTGISTHGDDYILSLSSESANTAIIPLPLPDAPVITSSSVAGNDMTISGTYGANTTQILTELSADDGATFDPAATYDVSGDGTFEIIESHIPMTWKVRVRGVNISGQGDPSNVVEVIIA